ncbi:hypothetical protein FACS1894137_14880 [Spirochaetia bacterium]|nr:hypothetical protein FACS1894137_14880 [Spirochaetia bacterium]
MYDQVLKELTEFKEFLSKQKTHFFYAENFIYAPSVIKIKSIIEHTKDKFLLLRGEESHSGSHAAHTAHWSINGGGSLIRQGCHPLSALLYLKQAEAAVRQEPVTIDSVIADRGVLTGAIPSGAPSLVAAKPHDVEDWAELLLTFSDGTKAQVISGDMIVGGVRNTIEAFTPQASYSARIAPNDALMIYHGNGKAVSDVYITEKVETHEGWQSVFIEEEAMRGYIGELTDFLDCIDRDRDPQSGFQLAFDTMRVLYGAYLSAETGRRFYFGT